jgi:DNA-directed RNA polymerase subunit M/transcription elongation factor TFIIS
VNTLIDVARFRQSDPDDLVTASLACPFCLYSEDVDWQFQSGDYDPSVECVCQRCEERWRVFMTPNQALRLVLLEQSLA